MGVTKEDEVELVKTHTFMRKHATGKAKIELHILHVERGLSWDKAEEKSEELNGAEEGFYVSHQVYTLSSPDNWEFPKLLLLILLFKSLVNGYTTALLIKSLQERISVATYI